jgi:hypothetical protein
MPGAKQVPEPICRRINASEIDLYFDAYPFYFRFPKLGQVSRVAEGDRVPRLTQWFRSSRWQPPDLEADWTCRPGAQM